MNTILKSLLIPLVAQCQQHLSRVLDCVEISAWISNVVLDVLLTVIIVSALALS